MKRLVLPPPTGLTVALLLRAGFGIEDVRVKLGLPADRLSYRRIALLIPAEMKRQRSLAWKWASVRRAGRPAA